MLIAVIAMNQGLEIKSMSESRLNVRIEGEMSNHVDTLIEQGLYSNQSEYVRDLIRHDMTDYNIEETRQSLIRGYADLREGNYKEFTNIKDALNYGHKVRAKKTGKQ